DHLFLAAFDVQLTAIVEFTDVARVEPAVLERGPCFLRCVVVPACDVLSAYEDFAVVGNPDLYVGHWLSPRAARGPQRVIERDNRRRLRQAISLDDGKSQASPERFEFRIER